MAPDVVSPRSVRVSAALAAARMILFTVFKLFTPLMVRSVLDMYSAEALDSFFLVLSTFVTDTVPEFLSMVASLALQVLDTIFSAIDPYVPEPPIQFCVLGSGIHCGADLYRPTVSDLADQLVCHLVDLVQSLFGFLVDALSWLFSSTYLSGIVECSLSYVPEPPIQFCVLGTGIHCGADLYRLTVSDLADQLVCYLVDLAQSSFGFLVDALSWIFSSTLLSGTVESFLSYVPEPPIQFCVLGTGIHCGADLYRPTVSDLADRLVCHLVDLALSSYGSFVDALSWFFSNTFGSGIVGCSLSLLFCFAVVFCYSLWLLSSFEAPLDGEELAVIIKADIIFILARSKVLAILGWLQRRVPNLLPSVLLLHIIWKSQNFSLWGRTNAGHTFVIHQLPGSFNQLLSLVLCSPIARYPFAAAGFAVVSAVFSYGLLFIWVIWNAYYRRIGSAITSSTDAQAVDQATDAPSISEVTSAPGGAISIVSSPAREDAAVVDAQNSSENVVIAPQPPQVGTEDVHDTRPSHVDADRTEPSNAGHSAADCDAPRNNSPLPVVRIKANTLSSYFPEGYDIHPEFHARYQLGVGLGAGGNGFVIEAQHRESGHKVAVKCISMALARSSVRPWYNHPVFGLIPRDVEMLLLVGKHDNIPTLIEVFRDETYVYVVQELCGTPWYPKDAHGQLIWPNGDRTLLAYILHHGPMPASDAIYVFKQLTQVVVYCHKMGLTHADIKPQNIAIDANLKIKLLDFGSVIFSRALPRPWFNDPRWYRGTVVYMPPEILNSERYLPEKGDVWSMGCVLFEMLTGRRAFANADTVKEGCIIHELSQLRKLDGLVALWPIIDDCLQLDPNERIGSLKLSKHRFLR